MGSIKNWESVVPIHKQQFDIEFQCGDAEIADNVERNYRKRFVRNRDHKVYRECDK